MNAADGDEWQADGHAQAYEAAQHASRELMAIAQNTTLPECRDDTVDVLNFEDVFSTAKTNG